MMVINATLSPAALANIVAVRLLWIKHYCYSIHKRHYGYIQALISQLKLQFEMIDFGILRYFLGLKISYTIG